MSSRMFTLELDESEANLAAVRKKFGLGKHDLIESFGVVALDPEKHLYAVLADDSAAPRFGQSATVKGPFANPKIEPFGPPK